MFISSAFAQTAGAAADPMGGLTGLLPIIVMFVVLWFVMIRPQMKKAKEHQKMVSELAKGDEVVTQGGVLGRITKVGDNFVTIEVSAGKDSKDTGTELHIQKHAIGAQVPKGTLKSL